jgi:hypothetical protein
MAGSKSRSPNMGTYLQGKGCAGPQGGSNSHNTAPPAA